MPELKVRRLRNAVVGSSLVTLALVGLAVFAPLIRDLCLLWGSIGLVIGMLLVSDWRKAKSELQKKS